MTDVARNESSLSGYAKVAPDGAPPLVPKIMSSNGQTGHGQLGHGSMPGSMGSALTNTAALTHGDARLSAEPESGIHPAVHVVAERAGDQFAEPALHVDLILLSVTETQVPPGWVAAADELEYHELTVMVRGTLCTQRDDDEASAGPVEALLLKPGVRRQERNGGEVDLHRLRISFHWKNAPADLTESVQDTCGRLHEIASWLVAELETPGRPLRSARKKAISSSTCGSVKSTYESRRSDTRS